VQAAVPVVRDPDSRLRRPLAELLEQLGSPSSTDAFVPAARPPHRYPLWNQLRAAVTFAGSSLGGAR
jgi:hypothetical protein